MEFVHLHLHSEYSMLDGACRLSLLPKAAKDLGFTALALTDHGNMFGAVTFYKECRKAGVNRSSVAKSMWHRAADLRKTRTTATII